MGQSGGRAVNADKISVTMLSAIVEAISNGEGKLHRWPGGFWTPVPWIKTSSASVPPRPWFGTQTIKSLVARGIAVETAHAGTNPFAVEVSINTTLPEVHALALGRAVEGLKTDRTAGVLKGQP